MVRPREKQEFIREPHKINDKVNLPWLLVKDRQRKFFNLAQLSSST